MKPCRSLIPARTGRALLGLWLAACAPHAGAQQPQDPGRNAPAAFDPSDVYFQGWLLTQDAEKLREKEAYTEALEKLRRAGELFDTIDRTFPDWKADMVRQRRDKTSELIAEVAPEALKEREADQRAVAELEGRSFRENDEGVMEGADPGRLDSGLPAAPIQPAREVETLESRRIAELQGEVERLKQEVGESSGREQLENQRDLAIARLQKARRELEQLRRRSAEKPVQQELDALSRRINSLEDEKDAMGRALEASRQETEKAQAQVGALQQERARLMRQVDNLRQDVADAERNLEIERKASNQVVEGQLTQIRELQNQLKQKDGQLARANRRIRGLETELREVRESFDELKQERDQLLRERDQMAALLKLNEAGQLQEVIDQNMALDRQLRESRERFDILSEDNEATKNDLVEALRDLAISKLNIQNYRRKNEEQQQRLEKLQSRLRHESRSLAEADVDPAEAEMLRGIIQKQLKVQEKREEARGLLMSTLGEKARQDEQIRRALNIFQGAELNLSPEELRVIDGKEVDGTIISPYARPRGEVEREMADLRDRLQPFEKAGTRAYQNGRLRAAREAFEMIVERNPGDDDAMCKLGNIEFRLQDLVAAADIFRQASELNPENPYAHRMLGHTLAKQEDYPASRDALERAVELAPTRAEGHLMLGNTLFHLGDLAAAEEAFRTAISCNPTAAEAYHNLAILHARQGRRKDGREQYRKALEHGAAPNPALEERLSESTGDATR